MSSLRRRQSPDPSFDEGGASNFSLENDELRGRYENYSQNSPPPMRRRSRSPGYSQQDSKNHYTPNYERDGYRPSPRNYHGRNDRFNNDSGGGYQRGSRMDRSPNDYRSNSNTRGGDPLDLDYEISFVQFCNHIRRTNPAAANDGDLKERYNAYRFQLQGKLARRTFEQHSQASWMKERYHPLDSRKWDAERDARKRLLFSRWTEEIISGKWDDVCLDEKEEVTQVVEDDSNEMFPSTAMGAVEGEEDGTGMEVEGQSCTLTIKSITPSIPREKILELVDKLPGFEYLALSDPNPSKKFHRVGWIKFSDPDATITAYEALKEVKIDDFAFHIGIHTDFKTRPRNTPDICISPARLEKDLNRADQIIHVLDGQLGVDSRMMLESAWDRIQLDLTSDLDEFGDQDIDVVKIKKQLDLRLVYLRKVHWFCYYCAAGAESLEDIDRRCPEFHRRRRVEMLELSGNERGTSWARKLDERLDFFDKQSTEIDLGSLGGTKVINIWEHITNEDESRWSCRYCPKLFLSAEFVIKHISKKHGIGGAEDDLVQEQYFNNFLLDPNRPTPSSNVNNHGNNHHHHHHNNSGNNSVGGFNMMQQSMGRHQSMIGNPAIISPFIQAAPFGTPRDQIPRLGFGTPTQLTTFVPGVMGMMVVTPGAAGMAAVGSAKDPRQVRSYVDLDRPADGDAPLNYG